MKKRLNSLILWLKIIIHKLHFQQESILGTLIDNIYYKLTEDTLSGILTNSFTDHQPYFTFINNICEQKAKQTIIKINIQSAEAMSNFENELI